MQIDTNAMEATAYSKVYVFRLIFNIKHSQCTSIGTSLVTLPTPLLAVHL